MLVALDGTSQVEYPFVTFDFTTQKWSHLVYGPFDHWMSSPDGEYLYYTTGNVDPKVMRIRFSDHKLEEITSLKNVGRIEDEVTAGGEAAVLLAAIAVPHTRYVGRRPRALQQELCKLSQGVG